MTRSESSCIRLLSDPRPTRARGFEIVEDIEVVPTTSDIQTRRHFDEPTRSEARIRSLDGVRGLAIILVCVWHFLPPTDPGALQQLLGPFRSLIAFGWSGVDLFFVLSGFLIGGILIDHRESSNYYRVFYLRRVARIFPLYYAFLLVGLIVHVVSADSLLANALFEHRAIAFWPHLFFLQNFFMVTSFGAQWLGATWSLAVEEQFYLLFPFVVRAMPPRRLIVIVIMLIVTAPLLRYGVIEASNVGRAQVLLFCRWDALAAGVFVAIAYRSAAWGRLLRVAHIGLIPFLAVALLFTSTSVPQRLLGQAIAVSLQHTVLLGLFALLIVCALDGGSRLSGILSARWLRYFGRISYGLYILHIPMLHGLHAAILQQLPTTATIIGAALTGAAFFAAVLVSELSYRFFEGPILQRARALPYAAPRAP